MPETAGPSPHGRADAYVAEEQDWRLFRGDGVQREVEIPAGPPWRHFAGPSDETARQQPYLIAAAAVDSVNAALYLRRPLLVTGRPGVGKSSLADAIAHELALGPVLRWPVNSRSALQDALYRYDAIGRLQDSNLSRNEGRAPARIGTFIRLGPLGNALALSAAGRPRVLLVDELDKGDVDLPNDLLNVFEEGWFEIPELSRLPADQASVEVLTADADAPFTVPRGIVRCRHFPLVVITSNGERDFPPAFLRRCLPLHLDDPGEQQLREIIAGHLGPQADTEELLTEFLSRRGVGDLATDQFLNAVFLRSGGAKLSPDGLLNTVLHHLNSGR